jgi:hypothetical protein
VTCDLASLASGNNATVTIVVSPPAAGLITNPATVAPVEMDPASDNNSVSNITTVAIPNGVDLTGTWLASISTCKGKPTRPKCLILGAFNCENHGTVASPKVVVRFYRSTDMVLDSSDTLLKEIKVGSLQPDETELVIFGSKLPRGTHGEGLFVIASVDPDEEVTETVENNNLLVTGPLSESTQSKAAFHASVEASQPHLRVVK